MCHCVEQEHVVNKILRFLQYNKCAFGDDRLRRKRLIPNGEPRGTDLVKSVHNLRAKRTNLNALPLAA
jgi:hypothetical protein